jgi:urocanate hydratase
MVGFQDAAPRCSTTATPPREAKQGGFERAFAFPGFVPAYIRPLFCEGKGPFRWAALSGDPADIAATDRASSTCSPTTSTLRAGSRWPGEGRVPGAAGADLLAGLRRARPAGLRFNEMVASGELSAPIVIGRDHLDSGSVASPYRETEAMPTAPTRSPTGRCSTRWSTPRPARPGCRSTTAAASASAARSTPGRCASPTAPTLAAQKLERVLTNDPGMGVIRHVDAGYDRAVEVAEERGVRVPMQYSHCIPRGIMEEKA